MSAQNIELSGNLFVSGSSTLSESLDVDGDVVVDGSLDVSGGVAFGDRLDVSGDVAVDGTLDVSGGVAFGDRLDVSGDVTMDGTLDVSGDVVVDGTLDVSGLLTATGGINADGFSVDDGTGNTTISGLLNANGGIKCDTDKFVVADGTGNTTIAGTLGVTGALTATGGINADGLSISPTVTEPKITLWDGGGSTDHYGFGVSSSQLNYHSMVDHVFYTDGRNGDGTERLRIKENGEISFGGNLISQGSGNFSSVNVLNDTDPNITIKSSIGESGRVIFGNAGHGVGRNLGLSTLTDGNDVVVHTIGSGSIGLITDGTERFRINKYGNTTIAGTLGVTGALTANGGITGNVTGNLTGNIAGSTTIAGNTYINNNQSTNPTLIVENKRLNGDCFVDIKNVARSQRLSNSGGWYRFLTGGGTSTNGSFYIKQYNGKTSAFIRNALTISDNGTVSGVFYNTSDDRIKKNEQFITNAIQTISKLRPQTYQKYDTMDCSGYYRFESGLIAQEIYYNVPELRHLVSVPMDADISGHILTSEDPSIDPDYSNWGTTPAGVNYSGLTAYLIKAIQEQQDIINEEKAKNQTQYNELLSLIQATEPTTQEPTSTQEPSTEPATTEPVATEEPTTEPTTQEPATQEPQPI